MFLASGPISKKFASKEISRVIEIRGDQTLEDLHHAVFKDYDRWDEHLYEFQLGKRPFDPVGPNYGILGSQPNQNSMSLDARTTKLDDLKLVQHRALGYWFDFGDDWYHQVHVDRIEHAIPTATYPSDVKRVGKSPPRHGDQQWSRSVEAMAKARKNRKAAKSKRKLTATEKRARREWKQKFVKRNGDLR